MCGTGLLVLTSSLNQLTPKLPQLLRLASERVSRRLYVHLLPHATLPPAYSPTLYSQLVGSLYRASAAVCPRLDVRVLLTHLKRRCMAASTASPIQLLLLENTAHTQQLSEFASRFLSNRSPTLQSVILSPIDASAAELHGDCHPQLSADDPEEHLVFDRVALGGTFDGIHAGHKTLLSDALLRCSQQITVGVTDTNMLTNKTLPELIAPCSERKRNVTELITDIDATVQPSVVSISDALGPCRDDPSLKLLVVSEETAAGADSVNSVRHAGGLPAMHVHVVPLLADERAERAPHEEAKLSSSSVRVRQLGELRKERPSVRRRAGGPYVIGVTGGLASGKSSVCRQLGLMGARLVDCDMLGHSVYEPGTPVLQAIVDMFGSQVLDVEGRVVRRRLAEVVFADPEQLKRLTDVTWPAIGELVEQRLDQLTADDVVVLEAAVLLEADWQGMCDEVWVTLVPRHEAVRRAVARDGCTEEQALRRLDNQLDNQSRVDAAHVVFCTLWSPEFTAQQVSRAWSQLRQDLARHQ